MNYLGLRPSSNIEDDRNSAVSYDPLAYLAPALSPLDILLNAQSKDQNPRVQNDATAGIDTIAQRLAQQNPYPGAYGWPHVAAPMDAFSRAVNQVVPYPAGTPLWLFLLGNPHPVQMAPADVGGGLNNIFSQ
jgi:hypothetical protein